MTQDGTCPQIGRCSFNNQTCGNAVISTGLMSDGVIGCNAFEDVRGSVKYQIGDVFEAENGVFGITDIQYEYRPALYRCAGIGGGAWSTSEDKLDNCKLIYRKKLRKE